MFECSIACGSGSEEEKWSAPFLCSPVGKKGTFLVFSIPQQDVSMEIERWQCNLCKRVLESILKD